QGLERKFRKKYDKHEELIKRLYAEHGDLFDADPSKAKTGTELYNILKDATKKMVENKQTNKNNLRKTPSPDDSEKLRIARNDFEEFRAPFPIQVLPVKPCEPKYVTEFEQTKTIKITAPFTPDYESNVLKSPTNIHPDTSYGFGGTVQYAAGGARP